ncbi:MAG: gfo/Idh/MocA family oxidoreductase, partial [Verrucomicrobiota bacterium]|nr:gfo/Idh/MocA family oxidoreductase [Verrucomicrobiota bacterium]
NPTTLEAVSSGINSETAPKWSIITYHFPKQGKRNPVKVVWYDGGKKPDPSLAKQKSLPGNGSILIGSKDSLYIPMYWGKGTFLSGATEADHKNVPETIEKPTDFNRHHYLEWIDACKGGRPAWSNFDYAGPMTEAMLLGLVALRTGEKIEWDAKKMQVTNLPKANQLVRHKYRKGWML